MKLETSQMQKQNATMTIQFWTVIPKKSFSATK
jgi:hypothetical protein